MKKYLIVLSSILMLFIVGCSKPKEDPKEVARHACEALKVMDFDTLKKYADDESAKQIEESQKRVKNAELQMDALPEPQRTNIKKIYDNQMAVVKKKMATINCEDIVIKEGKDKEHKIALIDGKPTNLRLIKNEWKLTK